MDGNGCDEPANGLAGRDRAFGGDTRCRFPPPAPLDDATPAGEAACD